MKIIETNGLSMKTVRPELVEGLFIIITLALFSCSNLSPLSQADKMKLLTEAQAQVDLPDNIEFPNGEEPSLCDRVGVTCCPINADGSFECLHPATNDNNLYVYVVDRNGRRVSEPIVERPNMNVLYTREAPKDTIVGPWGRPVVLTNDKGVVIGEGNDGNYAVRGDFEDGYQTLDVMGAEELAFDSANTQLAFRNPLDNIRTDILDFDLAGTLLDTDNVADIRRGALENTRSFSVLKYSGDGKLRFGREVEDVTLANAKQGLIYNALDATTDAEQVKFLEDGDGIIHKKTLAFDVEDQDADQTNNNEFALAVFSDPSGGVRIRMGTNTGAEATRRFGGDTSLPGSYDIKDVQIYSPNTSAANKGKALLLDAAGSRVGLVEFNYRLGAPRGVSVSSWVDIGAGKDPQSFALNTDRSKAYVVNQGDDTVSVVDLKDAAGTVLATPVVNSSINLRDSIPGKEITIRPNQVVLDSAGENLIIGGENLRSALVVPVPQ